MLLPALQALLIGCGFGYCLHSAGLTHYARIVNVYRLRDLTVLRFMLTALVVGALAIQASIALGFIARAPLPPTVVIANLVGGAVFGIGMATAGYCPGTIVAGARRRPTRCLAGWTFRSRGGRARLRFVVSVLDAQSDARRRARSHHAGGVERREPLAGAAGVLPGRGTRAATHASAPIAATRLHLQPRAAPTATSRGTRCVGLPF
jgi:hypothetical protein